MRQGTSLRSETQKTHDSPTKGSGIAQSALLVRWMLQRKTPQSADQGFRRQAPVASSAITSAIDRWLVNAQLSLTVTSRAAVAVSTCTLTQPTSRKRLSRRLY